MCKYRCSNGRGMARPCYRARPMSATAWPSGKAQHVMPVLRCTMRVWLARNANEIDQYLASQAVSYILHLGSQV